jgi:hypothetical protein
MRRLAPACALVCLVLLIATFSFAANTRTYAPVQDGFVTSGETVSTFAPDRILVKFTPEGLNNAVIREALDKSAGGDASWTGLASVDATLSALDVSRISRMHGTLKNRAVSQSLGVHRWYRVDVAEGTDIEAVAAALEADPNIEAATPDMRVFPSATPNDPRQPIT